MRPVRTCVVCRNRRDDTEMIRAGRDDNGKWSIGRGPGRGIWLCADGVCSEEVQSGHIARSLRSSVSESDVEQLSEMINRSK